MDGTTPEQVHATLGQKLLADGLSVVFDPQHSRGSVFRDARSGHSYVDFFGFFASLPLGFNHPALTDEEWVRYIGRWSVHKPSNSDIYTSPFADFVRTFDEIAVPAEMKHLFFVSGGALAVENALKTAFDWKSRLNRARGKQVDATRIVHLQDAFHGRSGYTLSLTNTDPVKTDLFPKFDWPRIPNPWCHFPLTGKRLAETRARETESLTALRKILDQGADSVAGIILEPIQCEGGDHHFRNEYLVEVRKLADQHDVLLIFDEVQTGLGGTGRMWCYQHFDLIPDIVAFGKKTQVCGIMATDRLDEVPDNVFRVSSRINSTWGGNLVDMIRATRILEVYRDQGILENVNTRGVQLLDGATALQRQHPSLITNARGRGLFVALDLPSGQQRRALIEAAFQEDLMILGCGAASVRFRPALDIDEDTLREGLRRLGQAIERIV